MSIFFKKFLSFLLVVCFSATSGGSIPSVFAQDVISGNTIRTISPGKIVLPEALGSIQDLYQAVSVTPGPSAKENKLIVEIQDAHGILEAQQNIKAIIQLLQDKYGMNTIGLEGGVGRISSAVYRSLPDPVIKEKIVTEYLKRGELSGGEAAMILNPKVGNYYGIENKDLYFKNRDAFLNALKVRPSILKSLDKLVTKLDTIRSSIYSHELISFDNKAKEFQDERITLIDFSNVLKSEAERLGIYSPKPIPVIPVQTGIQNEVDPLVKPEDDKGGGHDKRGRDDKGGFSTRYPSLDTLFTAQAKDKEMETSEALKQKGSRFIREMQPIIQKDLNPEELRIFNSKLQDYQTGTLDQVAFLQYLHTKAQEHNIPLSQYEDIQNYFSHRDKLQRIEGEKLFAEIKLLTQEIKRGLSKTQEALELDSIYDHITLIRKLAKLEALHEDLNQYEANPQDYTPDFFNKYLAKYQDRFTDSWELSASEAFYRYARERDQVLFDNFLKALKDQKQSQGILVTGGFHTEGLKLKFKDAGYSYLILSPKISRFDIENPYERVMSGDLSYLRQSKLQVVLATAGLDAKQRDKFVQDFVKNGSIRFTQEEEKAIRDGLTRKGFAEGWINNFIKLYQNENGILADPSKYIKLINESLQKIGVTESAQNQVTQALAQASSGALQVITQAIAKNQEIFVGSINDLKTRFQKAKLPKDVQTWLFRVYIESLVGPEQKGDVAQKIADANTLISQLVDASNKLAVINTYQIVLQAERLQREFSNLKVLDLKAFMEAQQFVDRLKTETAKKAALEVIEAMGEAARAKEKAPVTLPIAPARAASLGKTQRSEELQEDFDITNRLFRADVKQASGIYQDHLRFIKAIAMLMHDKNSSEVFTLLAKTTQPVYLTQEEASLFLRELTKYKERLDDRKKGDSRNTLLYETIQSLSNSLAFGELAPSIKHRYISSKYQYAVRNMWQNDLNDLSHRGRIISSMTDVLEAASKIKDGVIFPLDIGARSLGAQDGSLGAVRPGEDPLLVWDRHLKELKLEKGNMERTLKISSELADEWYQRYRESMEFLDELVGMSENPNTAGLFPEGFKDRLTDFIKRLRKLFEDKWPNFRANYENLIPQYESESRKHDLFDPILKMIDLYKLDNVPIPQWFEKGAGKIVNIAAHPEYQQLVKLGQINAQIADLKDNIKKREGKSLGSLEELEKERVQLMESIRKVELAGDLSDAGLDRYANVQYKVYQDMLKYLQDELAEYGRGDYDELFTDPSYSETVGRELPNYIDWVALLPAYSPEMFDQNYPTFIAGYDPQIQERGLIYLLNYLSRALEIRKNKKVPTDFKDGGWKNIFSVRWKMDLIRLGRINSEIAKLKSQAGLLGHTYEPAILRNEFSPYSRTIKIENMKAGVLGVDVGKVHGFGAKAAVLDHEHNLVKWPSAAGMMMDPEVIQGILDLNRREPVRTLAVHWEKDIDSPVAAYLANEIIRLEGKLTPSHKAIADHVDGMYRRVYSQDVTGKFQIDRSHIGPNSLWARIESIYGQGELNNPEVLRNVYDLLAKVYNHIEETPMSSDQLQAFLENIPDEVVGKALGIGDNIPPDGKSAVTLHELARRLNANAATDWTRFFDVYKRLGSRDGFVLYAIKMLQLDISRSIANIQAEFDDRDISKMTAGELIDRFFIPQDEISKRAVSTIQKVIREEESRLVQKQNEIKTRFNKIGALVLPLEIGHFAKKGWELADLLRQSEFKDFYDAVNKIGPRDAFILWVSRIFKIDEAIVASHVERLIGERDISKESAGDIIRDAKLIQLSNVALNEDVLNEVEALEQFTFVFVQDNRKAPAVALAGEFSSRNSENEFNRFQYFKITPLDEGVVPDMYFLRRQEIIDLIESGFLNYVPDSNSLNAANWWDLGEQLNMVRQRGFLAGRVAVKALERNLAYVKAAGSKLEGDFDQLYKAPNGQNIPLNDPKIKELLLSGKLKYNPVAHTFLDTTAPATAKALGGELAIGKTLGTPEGETRNFGDARHQLDGGNEGRQPISEEQAQFLMDFMRGLRAEAEKIRDAKMADWLGLMIEGGVTEIQTKFRHDGQGYLGGLGVASRWTGRISLATHLLGTGTREEIEANQMIENTAEMLKEVLLHEANHILDHQDPEGRMGKGINELSGAKAANARERSAIVRTAAYFQGKVLAESDGGWVSVSFHSVNGVLTGFTRDTKGFNRTVPEELSGKPALAEVNFDGYDRLAHFNEAGSIGGSLGTKIDPIISFLRTEPAAPSTVPAVSPSTTLRVNLVEPLKTGKSLGAVLDSYLTKAGITEIKRNSFRASNIWKIPNEEWTADKVRTEVARARNILAENFQTDEEYYALLRVLANLQMGHTPNKADLVILGDKLAEQDVADAIAIVLKTNELDTEHKFSLTDFIYLMMQQRGAERIREDKGLILSLVDRRGIVSGNLTLKNIRHISRAEKVYATDLEDSGNKLVARVIFKLNGNSQIQDIYYASRKSNTFYKLPVSEWLEVRQSLGDRFRALQEKPDRSWASDAFDERYTLFSGLEKKAFDSMVRNKKSGAALIHLLLSPQYSDYVRMSNEVLDFGISKSSAQKPGAYYDPDEKSLFYRSDISADNEDDINLFAHEVTHAFYDRWREVRNAPSSAKEYEEMSGKISMVVDHFIRNRPDILRAIMKSPLYYRTIVAPLNSDISTPSLEQIKSVVERNLINEALAYLTGMVVAKQEKTSMIRLPVTPADIELLKNLKLIPESFDYPFATEKEQKKQRPITFEGLVKYAKRVTEQYRSSGKMPAYGDDEYKRLKPIETALNRGNATLSIPETQDLDGPAEFISKDLRLPPPTIAQLEALRNLPTVSAPGIDELAKETLKAAVPSTGPPQAQLAAAKALGEQAPKEMEAAKKQPSTYQKLLRIIPLSILPVLFLFTSLQIGTSQSPDTAEQLIELIRKNPSYDTILYDILGHVNSGKASQFLKEDYKRAASEGHPGKFAERAAISGALIKRGEGQFILENADSLRTYLKDRLSSFVYPYSFLDLEGAPSSFGHSVLISFLNDPDLEIRRESVLVGAMLNVPEARVIFKDWFLAVGGKTHESVSEFDALGIKAEEDKTLFEKTSFITDLNNLASQIFEGSDIERVFLNGFRKATKALDVPDPDDQTALYNVQAGWPHYFKVHPNREVVDEILKLGLLSSAARMEAGGYATDVFLYVLSGAPAEWLEGHHEIIRYMDLRKDRLRGMVPKKVSESELWAKTREALEKLPTEAENLAMSLQVDPRVKKELNRWNPYGLQSRLYAVYKNIVLPVKESFANTTKISATDWLNFGVLGLALFVWWPMVVSLLTYALPTEIAYLIKQKFNRSALLGSWEVLKLHVVYFSASREKRVATLLMSGGMATAALIGTQSIAYAALSGAVGIWLTPFLNYLHTFETTLIIHILDRLRSGRAPPDMERWKKLLESRGISIPTIAPLKSSETSTQEKPVAVAPSAELRTGKALGTGVKLDLQRKPIDLNSFPADSKIRQALEYLRSKGLSQITLFGSTVWGQFVKSSLPGDRDPHSESYDAKAPKGEIDLVLRDKAQYRELAEKLGLDLSKVEEGEFEVDGWKFDILGWMEDGGRRARTYLKEIPDLFTLPGFSFEKIGISTEGELVDPFGGIRDADSKTLKWVNPENKPLSYNSIAWFLSFYFGQHHLQARDGSPTQIDEASRRQALSQMAAAFDRKNPDKSKQVRTLEKSYSAIEKIKKMTQDYADLDKLAARQGFWQRLPTKLRMYSLQKLISSQFYFTTLGMGPQAVWSSIKKKDYKNAGETLNYLLSTVLSFIVPTGGYWQRLNRLVFQEPYDIKSSRRFIFFQLFGTFNPEFVVMDYRYQGNYSLTDDRWGIGYFLRDALLKSRDPKAVLDTISEAGGGWLLDATGLGRKTETGEYQILKDLETFRTNPELYSRMTDLRKVAGLMVEKQVHDQMFPRAAEGKSLGVKTVTPIGEQGVLSITRVQPVEAKALGESKFKDFNDWFVNRPQWSGRAGQNIILQNSQEALPYYPPTGLPEGETFEQGQKTMEFELSRDVKDMADFSRQILRDFSVSPLHEKYEALVMLDPAIRKVTVHIGYPKQTDFDISVMGRNIWIGHTHPASLSEERARELVSQGRVKVLNPNLGFGLVFSKPDVLAYLKYLRSMVLRLKGLDTLPETSLFSTYGSAVMSVDVPAMKGKMGQEELSGALQAAISKVSQLPDDVIFPQYFEQWGMQIKIIPKNEEIGDWIRQAAPRVMTYVSMPAGAPAVAPSTGTTGSPQAPLRTGKAQGASLGLELGRLLREEPKPEEFERLIAYLDQYLSEDKQELLNGEELEILKKIRFQGETYGPIADIHVLRYLFSRDSQNRLLIQDRLSSIPKLGTDEDIIIRAQYSVSDRLDVAALGHGKNRFAYTVAYSSKDGRVSPPLFFVKVTQEDVAKKKPSGTRDEGLLYKILRPYFSGYSDLPFAKIYDTRPVGSRWVQSGQVVEGKDLQKIEDQWLLKSESATGLSDRDMRDIRSAIYNIGQMVGSLYAQTGLLWGDLKPANVVLSEMPQSWPGQFDAKEIDYETLIATPQVLARLLAELSPKIQLPSNFRGIQEVHESIYRDHLQGTLKAMIPQSLRAVLAGKMSPNDMNNRFLAGFYDILLLARKGDEALARRELSGLFNINLTEGKMLAFEAYRPTALKKLLDLQKPSPDAAQGMSLGSLDVVKAIKLAENIFAQKVQTDIKGGLWHFTLNGALARGKEIYVNANGVLVLIESTDLSNLAKAVKRISADRKEIGHESDRPAISALLRAALSGKIETENGSFMSDLRKFLTDAALAAPPADIPDAGKYDKILENMNFLAFGKIISETLPVSDQEVIDALLYKAGGKAIDVTFQLPDPIISENIFIREPLKTANKIMSAHRSKLEKLPVQAVVILYSGISRLAEKGYLGEEIEERFNKELDQVQGTLTEDDLKALVERVVSGASLGKGVTPFAPLTPSITPAIDIKGVMETFVLQAVVVPVKKDKTAYFALPQDWGGKAVQVQDVLVQDSEELATVRFRVQMAPSEKSGVPEDLLVKLAAASRKSLAQIGKIENNCYDVSTRLAKNLQKLFPKARQSDIAIVGNQLLLARSYTIDFPPDWDNATQWADHYVTYFKVGDSYYAVDLMASQYLDAEGKYTGEIFKASSLEDLRTMLSAYYGGPEGLWDKVNLAEAANFKAAVVRMKDLKPKFDEMSSALLDTLIRQDLNAGDAQEEAARMMQPFLAPDLEAPLSLDELAAYIAREPRGAGFRKFREWADLPLEAMLDEIVSLTAERSKEKILFRIAVMPSLGIDLTRELFPGYAMRFSRWELRSLAEYFVERSPQDIEQMFAQANSKILKRLNVIALSKIMTDMMNEVTEKRLSTEGLTKRLGILGFSEPLAREIAVKIQEPIQRAVLGAEKAEAGSLGMERVNKLKSDMMENPAASQSVMQRWRQGFRLGLKAPAERIRAPLNLQITQLVSWREIQAITEFVGVENISIVLHLSPAQKEDPAFKKLLEEVKQFTMANPNFNFKVMPASENAKSLKVTRNISSPVHEDNTKFLVLAGDQTLGQEIQGKIPQRAQGKTLVVAYRNTGISELDAMLLEVFSLALLGTAKPTEYLKQALIGLIEIDRGVVIPIINAIINKFERDLAQTKAQAIAA